MKEAAGGALTSTTIMELSAAYVSPIQVALSSYVPISKSGQMYEYCPVPSVVSVARMPQVFPICLCQIVTVSSMIAGVMDPLMVVLSPIVMVVGEAVIDIEPLDFPVLTCAIIKVKTSIYINSRAVKRVIDRFLNFCPLSLSFYSFCQIRLMQPFY